LTRRAACLVAIALALTGCHSGNKPPRTIVETRFLDQLAAAIDGVNAARQRLADDGAAIAAAAAALDRVDGVAVTGDRAAVRRARNDGGAAIAKGMSAARRTPASVKGYAAAVAALAAAPSNGLTAEQVNALRAVTQATSAEATALRSYGTVVATVWPRYAALDDNQRLWLARASNGWYRDQREAAGNYLVLGDRAALDAGRRSLVAADAARLAAARAAARAIGDARGALASLLK
jgi:hypothetical protein